MRSATVTSLMAAMGHEQVVFLADRDAGLRGIIAIHSTALGPSLGGVRFWRYASEHDALLDALRLSEAMTLKAAAAGLHQGGGKAVVWWDEPDRPRPKSLLHALGRAIDDLGGRYLAAEDVGATTADMDGIAEVTQWVTGVDEARGGSGDPSPVTALGVVHAMRAACGALDGEPSLRDRRVVIQGAGHVGAHLARALVADGAVVSVTDLFEERAESLARELDIATLPAGDALFAPCDVLAPCALGGVFDDDCIPRLRCRAIVGAANNQLGVATADRDLAERGILFVPDFVASAGGILNIAEEFTGYDRARALARAAGIGETTARVLSLSREAGVTPQRAAVDLARRRIAEEGRGRWRPGDPSPFWRL
ncbi:MAG TPA: Glu/Leu/Phe/Val dehydrogenase dimerization domain-containing protein [Acidimicrobiia bacterium]|nr:Glu/Leu/Phe/Val dehydrogenase dimerization domain-containing protein [Acidimicrobiia bacterium]